MHRWLQSSNHTYLETIIRKMRFMWSHQRLRKKINPLTDTKTPTGFPSDWLISSSGNCFSLFALDTSKDFPNKQSSNAILQIILSRPFLSPCFSSINDLMLSVSGLSMAERRMCQNGDKFFWNWKKIMEKGFLSFIFTHRVQKKNIMHLPFDDT